MPSVGPRRTSRSASYGEPSKKRYTNGSGIPPWFRLVWASILLAVFVASYIKDMTDVNYEVPGGIYAIVVVVVGFIFGAEAVKGMVRR